MHYDYSMRILAALSFLVWMPLAGVCAADDPFAAELYATHLRAVP
jgi:hypothetical protein